MEKVTAFLKQHAILINSFFILFWLWILYDSFQRLQTESFSVTQIGGLLIPVLLLTLSFYNLSRAIKAKKRN